MPKLASLKRETADVTIPVEGDEPLTVTFRKGFMSPTLAAQFDAAESKTAAEQLQIMADMVLAAVIAWNLTDDTGSTIPLTRDAVNAVNADALTLIIRAMQEALQIDPLSEGSSSNGSAPKEGSDAAPTGSRSR